MDKLNYLFPFVGILLFFCCGVKTSTTATKESVTISNGITFEWPSIKGRKIPGETQIFRLYRFDSFEIRSQSDWQFKFNHMQDRVVSDTFLNLSIEEKQLLFDPDEVYGWEVVRVDNNRIIKYLKTMKSFNINTREPIRLDDFHVALDTPQMQTLLSVDGTISESLFHHIPNECKDKICQIDPLLNKIHWVTLTSLDIVGGESFRFGQPLPSDCIHSSEEGIVKLNAAFDVNAPCDKLNQVDPSTIQVSLFKSDVLITNNDQRSIEFVLNENPNSISNALTIEPVHYLEYCSGTLLNNDSLSCKAKVNLLVSFNTMSNLLNPEEDYTLVFYLPETNDHHHFQDSLENSVHLNEEICTDYSDDTKLAYYICRDTIDDHVALHTVVIPLDICQLQLPQDTIRRDTVYDSGGNN